MVMKVTLGDKLVVTTHKCMFEFYVATTKWWQWRIKIHGMHMV